MEEGVLMWGQDSAGRRVLDSRMDGWMDRLIDRSIATDRQTERQTGT